LGGERPVVVPRPGHSSQDEFIGFQTFTPKGHLAGAEYLSGTLVRLRICDVDSDGTPKQPIRQIDLPVKTENFPNYSLSFSNDEKRVLLSKSANGTLFPIGVFDLDTSRILLGVHDQRFHFLSPDGKRVAVNEDGYIRLWAVDENRRLPALRSLTWCNKVIKNAIVIAPDWTRVAIFAENASDQIRNTGKNAEGLFYWSIPAPLKLDEGE